MPVEIDLTNKTIVIMPSRGGDDLPSLIVGEATIKLVPSSTGSHWVITMGQLLISKEITEDVKGQALITMLSS